MTIEIALCCRRWTYATQERHVVRRVLGCEEARESGGYLTSRQKDCTSGRWGALRQGLVSFSCAWRVGQTSRLRSRQRAFTLKIYCNIVTPYVGRNISNDTLPSIGELNTVGVLRQGGRYRDLKASRPHVHIA